MSSDFYDWKRHPVTQAVFSELANRITFLTEQLVEQAASASQTELAEKAGAIKALRDIINIENEGEDSNGN